MRKLSETVSQTILAGEWDFERNKIRPTDVSVTSMEKVWWKCAIGHRWKTSPKCRRANKSGCHYCSGKIATNDGNFAFLYPLLLREWDYTKNEKKPSFYLPQSNRKVWWKCIKGHSWEATIQHRTKDESGCPLCMSGWQTSRLELRILSELQGFFSDAVGRSTVGGAECDIYIPSLSLGIEVDGYHWHSDKTDKDTEKNKDIESSGCKLIRVREAPLERISDLDIVCTPDESNVSIFKRLLERIESVCQIGPLDFGEFVGDDKYRELLTRSRRNGKNLQVEFPVVASEWHPTKNKPLMPEDVAPRSTLSVWWLCKKCGNEYEKRVYKRTYHGCPYCGGKRAWHGNSLRGIVPEMANDWNYERNNGLTPDDVTYGSHRKVWWRCQHCSFEWEQTVNARTSANRKCRKCGGSPSKEIAERIHTE